VGETVFLNAHAAPTDDGRLEKARQVHGHGGHHRPRGRKCKPEHEHRPVDGNVRLGDAIRPARFDPSVWMWCSRSDTYRKNSGEIKRGTNSAISGHKMSSARTPSIGTSIRLVSQSASFMRMPATEHAIDKVKP
jgi:hypothetical protein